MQILRFLCFLALLVTAGPVFSQKPALTAIGLRTDSQENPLGIDARQLQFSWTLGSSATSARGLAQSAYRIRLATSPHNLASNPVWDSGRVDASTYWQRPYQGSPLHAHMTYFWQVQVWGKQGLPGPWSAMQSFTTALLDPQDWSAHWIAAQPDGPPPPPASADSHLMPSPPPPLPVFRHEFRLQKPVASALLFVTGLGQYEVHLNGKDVTKSVMNPGWTNYRKTVLYNTYDVTSLLHRSSNAIGVLLGNGMYNVEGVQGHYTKFTGSFGQPKCLLQLEVTYADGTSERFVSDRSWRTHPGPIVYSSIYGGEEFDARALPQAWDSVGFNDRDWQPAVEVAGPGSGPGPEAAAALQPQQTQPIVVAQTYNPVRITHPHPGIDVYDLGEMMSGWPRIAVRGPSGAKVSLLAGELLNPDGTVTQKSVHAFPEDPVVFDYTLRGGGPETWHPRFSYTSFRYVQVTTQASSSSPQAKPSLISLQGDFVHANAPVVGTFASSSDLFQKIHTLIDRAVLSNLASIVTDCPSREKLGWLEQTYLNASTLMLNYDVTGLYEKMGRDMQESQLPDGLVPSTSPEFVAFLEGNGKNSAARDSPEWGSAVILSPWALYRYTGDTRPLSDTYPAMQRYADYLTRQSHDGILNYGLGDWYDIGPKPPGGSQLTSTAVTATGVFYEDLITLAKIAQLLDKPQDAAHYSSQAQDVRRAFNARLFHPETNQYDRGSQTANAIPLALGLVPEGHAAGVLQNLVADIHAHHDHVTSGDVGFHYLVTALTEQHRSDVLAAMFSRTDVPSYGYQITRGATTLTEAWDANPDDSQNHFMLGHGEQWFYQGLAGLSVDMSHGPDDAIQLTPSFLPGITHASASFAAPMGEVKLRWQTSSAGVSVDVTIPIGAQAHLTLPAASDWTESTVALSAAPGILSSHADASQLHLTLGSGSYRFTTRGPLSN